MNKYKGRIEYAAEGIEGTSERTQAEVFLEIAFNAPNQSTAEKFMDLVSQAHSDMQLVQHTGRIYYNVVDHVG